MRLDDFIKHHEPIKFKIEQIGLRPHIFFGTTSLDNDYYFEYVIFNREYMGGNHKTCGFKKLQKNTINRNNGERRIELNIVDIEENEINNILESGINSNSEYIPNTTFMVSILDHLIYNEPLSKFKTIRKKLYELLKDIEFSIRSKIKQTLFGELEIPDYFFEIDYLPEIITSKEKYIVPHGFYNILPKKIEYFQRPTTDEDIVEITVDSIRSKRPDFLKRRVYYTKSNKTAKYIYFSKNKDSEYYNIAVHCYQNNTIYIGIYNRNKGIVIFYPIDKDIFSRFTYPLNFIELIYLYFPKVNNIVFKYENIPTKIKSLEFYSEYISNIVNTGKNNVNIRTVIQALKSNN